MSKEKLNDQEKNPIVNLSEEQKERYIRAIDGKQEPENIDFKAFAEKLKARGFNAQKKR